MCTFEMKKFPLSSFTRKAWFKPWLSGKNGGFETIKVRLGPAACSAKGLEVAKTNKEAIEEKERKKDQVEQWRRNKEKLGEEEWL